MPFIRRNSTDAEIAAVALLAEPVRRDLFDFVKRSPGAVSRHQAASGVGVPAHTAKFHLDRLVEEGLLEVEFKRLSGRTGPGSGRPAKLYRRTDLEVNVSMPERHYDLLSRILATSVAEATTTGVPVADVVARVARLEGETWGSKIGTPDDVAHLERLAAALSDGGYEPSVEHDTMYLTNCPFHRVAQEQTELVCGLNLEFVTGVASGSGCDDVSTCLEPDDGRCCVVARAKDTARR